MVKVRPQRDKHKDNARLVWHWCNLFIDFGQGTFKLEKEVFIFDLERKLNLVIQLSLSRFFCTHLTNNGIDNIE